MDQPQILVKDQIAIFGAGCFWEAEDAFINVKGVSATEVGFCEDGSNRKFLVKRANKIEVVKIKFDPETISYEDLLEIFWEVHDPTLTKHLDKSYGERSVIFSLNEKQKEIAEISKQAKGHVKGSDPIFTEITNAGAYYRAGNRDQKYLQKRRLNH